MKKIRAQIDRLKEVYPDRAVCIDLKMWDYSSGEKERQWGVYVDTIYPKSLNYFDTFKELVAFIDGHVKF